MDWRQVVKWVMVLLYSVVVFVAPVTPNVYTGIKCIKNMNTQKLLVRCAVFFSIEYWLHKEHIFLEYNRVCPLVGIGPHPTLACG